MSLRIFNAWKKTRLRYAATLIVEASSASTMLFMNNRMTLCTSTKAYKRSGLPEFLYPKILPASGKRLRPGLSAELSSRPRDSPDPLNRKARATLGTHVIKFQPTERCDVSRLDPEDLLAAVSSFAADPELRRLQLLRVSSVYNTVTVTTCDSTQAAHLLRTTSLPLKTHHPLPIRTYQVPTEGISRGVIHECKPNESPEKLLSALNADGVDILSARRWVPVATTLIIFATPKPPSEVTYWHFPWRVERYEQRFHVCQRFHKPGHKAAVYPAEKPVCANCGKQHDLAPEQFRHAVDKFCVRCNDSGHVSTDASCPTGAQFAQKVKESEEAKQERRSRTRIRHRRRRRSRNPKRSIQLHGPLHVRHPRRETPSFYSIHVYQVKYGYNPTPPPLRNGCCICT
ncbi:hypothetical protein ISCGN_017655 [Ixodes scapularis]